MTYFTSGPVVLVAAARGIPTLLLEQNAVPGLTNRLLARFVRAAAVTYESTLGYFGSKGFVSGNPVRPEFFEVGAAAKRAGEVTPGRRPSVLVFGGSQGAHAINFEESSARTSSTPPRRTVSSAPPGRATPSNPPRREGAVSAAAARSASASTATATDTNPALGFAVHSTPVWHRASKVQTGAPFSAQAQRLATLRSDCDSGSLREAAPPPLAI
jgi:hypothetical protein